MSSKKPEKTKPATATKPTATAASPKSTAAKGTADSADCPAPTAAPAPQIRVLLIDDDDGIRYSLRRTLDGHGYAITEAASGEKGLKIAPALKPHVILLDNRMDGISGIETLQHLRTAAPDALTILMTAFGTTQTAIEAMKYGAFDYIMKPFEPNKLLALVASAVRTFCDQEEAAKSDYKPLLDCSQYKEGIVGNSEAMQDVIKTIGRFAAKATTVLVTGESGTGKELVARCVHQHSLRARGPFNAVNCAAIPESLIESELFGHEKGSFTSAVAQKLGKFELSDGGTIFLDEIGDMSLSAQTKILRALQEKEIQRVGGTAVIKVDVRLVAATNKNLEKMVAEKTFREDLYYRLNVVRLRLPALRERPEDIPLLVDFMLQRFAANNKTRPRRLSAAALETLSAYNWPGNVRELENVINRAAVVARGDTILATDLPAEIFGANASADIGAAAAAEASAEARASAAAANTAATNATATAAPPTPPKPLAPPKPVTSLSGIKVPPPTLPASEIYDQLTRHLAHTLKHDALATVENELIARLFEATLGNQSTVSRFLGMSRTLLAKRAEELGVS